MTTIKEISRRKRESGVVRAFKKKSKGNRHNKLIAFVGSFILVSSCNVYAETDFPTSSGGGGGGGSGAGTSAPLLQGPNVTANRAPDVMEELGVGAVIGMPPTTSIVPPVQVSKSSGSIPTLAKTVVNATVYNSKGNCQGDQPAASDPVSLSTGAKVDAITDFSLPGEMGLNFTRYYSSDFWNQGAPNTRTGVWTTSFDYLLSTDVTQSCKGDGYCPMVLIHPDGTIVQFGAGQKNSDGSVSYTELNSGIATMNQSASGIFTLHDEDSKIITFSTNTVASTYGAHQLRSLVDQAGVGWMFSYPDSSDMVVTHTSGQTVSLHWVESTSPDNGGYDIDRQLTVTDPAGNKYVYNTVVPNGYASTSGTNYLFGQLQSAVLPGPTTTTVSYTYTSAAPGGAYQFARTEVDYNGVAHDTTAYNSAGQVISDGMADGTQKYTFSYSSNGKGPVTTVTNPLGHVSVYQFNTQYNVLSVTGQASSHCAATFSSRTYDSNGNVQSETDNDGNITDYTYAANGEILQRVEGPGPFQRETDFVWDPTPNTDRLLSVTVANYKQTAFTYNAQGRLASITQTNTSANGVANQTQTTTYNYALYSNGIVSSAATTYPSANNANTLTYSYDGYGNVTSISNALGQATTFSNFTGNGLPQTITSPNGDVTNYVYNAGLLTSKSHTHNGIASTQYISYDPKSRQISQIVLYDGETISYSYDTDFKTLSSTWNGPSGAAITKSYSYDSNGDITSTSWTRQGLGTPDLVTHTSYDELGRAILITGNNGQSTSLSYDTNGNLSKTVDANGNATSYLYDDVGRVQYVTDATGKSSLYLYDFGDLPLQTTDPRGLTTYYKYDAFGDLWSLSSPDTGNTNYVYDAYGRRTSTTTNNGVQTTYAYDTLNRVTSASSSAQTYTYSYDSCAYGKGFLCAYAGVNGGGSSSLTYTIEGMINTRTDNSFLGAATTTYNYDGMNRLTQIVYGGGAVNYGWTDDQVSAVTYVPNAQGSQAVPLVSGVKYDALRRPLGWTYGNGIVRAQIYDQDERLTSISSALGSMAIQSLIYSWNNLNQITAISNTAYPSASQSFGYDSLYRLTSQTGAAPLSLTYDSNGNRTQQNWMTNDTVGVATSNNQINSRGAHTYSYDGNGNRATDTVNGVTTTYTYDEFNRLNSVARSASLSSCETNYQCPTYPSGKTTYQIDALGQLVLSNGPAGVWMYGYGLNGELTGELTAPASGSNNSNLYIYLNGQPVAMFNSVAGGSLVPYFIHDDHLGRPEVITNGGGSIVWHAQNYAFDRAIITSGVPDVDIGLPGQVYDAETGNWSNGFRDYDSSNGRYLESDPIGIEAGANTYAYTDNNPISSIDPNGLLCFDFDKFADYIRDNRADLSKTAAALGATLGVGTMPKVPSELRGLGVSRSELNPYTSQLSRWSGRLGTRSLRLLGRSSLGVAAGAIATGATIGEGFYDLTIEAEAAVNATSSNECDCKGK